MLMNKNHEKELLENTVKRFVEEELYPHEETVDKNGEVPLELGRQIEKKSKGVPILAKIETLTIIYEYI